MRLIPQPVSVKEFPTFTRRNSIDEKLIDNTITKDGEYELYITPDKITAKAGSEKGLFYAEVTLKQLVSLYTKIPCMKINDYPRYSHRGFMIDCARHMFSVSELKKMIDAASSVKLNIFHWHLSDDQGFRIELDTLPELTQKGSVRKCDTFRNMECNEEYKGYYTKEDIAEIISYCRERFIDVVPELDMPGHLSAFLHVYPQFTCSGNDVEVKTKQGIFSDILCVGNEEGYRQITKLLDEICNMFPYDTIHIGGDEVPKKNWMTCEKCRRIMLENKLSSYHELQGWYMNKVAEYLKNKQKKCIVWNDCLNGGNISPELHIQHWMHSPKTTAQAVNSGSKLILSPFDPYYVDYPYGMHPLKSAYMFEPESFSGLSEEGKNNITGVESPIWTEFIKTDDRLEYMCFPRWFALAEVAWTDKENKDYKEFYSVLKKLSVYYRNNGLNVAPEEDWNPTPFDRLRKTAQFFI